MDYKKQIKTFLEDEENYSLFINGSWGVGKTYLWKEIENEINLKNDQKEFYNRFKSNFNFFNHILLLIEFIKTYGKKFLIFIVDYFSFCYFDKCKPKPIKKNIVYISLFGKEHYKEILEEVTLKTYNYKKILYFLRNLTFWKISIGAFLQFFIKNDFKNLIICFDDLERKSDKLSIKDILGLINQLKEEKCKVILISNENELSNDKEIFDAYKEKSLDLNIHIHSKAEVISQILKEKSPEILKEIIPSLVYKIDNLRTLNKIIKAFKIFNKELEFSQNLNQEKNYKDLFELVLEKVVLRFENIKINDIEQKYIHIKYTSKQIIDDIIQNYFDNANYFISNDKKENFKKELKNFKFYVDLAKLKNLLKNSIQYPNENNKDEIEKIFNNINEEKLNDLVYNLGFINFIALDQMFHFDNNKRILEIKKYCLKLANVSNYDEKIINIICDGNEELKEYDKKLKIKKTQESNLDSCKLYKLEIENKYKDIENYAHFLQNMQKIDKLTEEEINQFLENKIIFSFCDIGFKTNESQKNFYPQLYKIYKSIKDNKN